MDTPRHSGVHWDMELSDAWMTGTGRDDGSRLSARFWRTWVWIGIYETHDVAYRRYVSYPGAAVYS